MTDDDFDTEYVEQQLALEDMVAWHDIYARACRRARASGFAQLILERGPTDYGRRRSSRTGPLPLSWR